MFIKSHELIHLLKAVNLNRDSCMTLKNGGVMGEWLYKFRNPILLTVIFLGYLHHASNGIWVDDFWDHSAVVSELIRNPWNPKHPQLGNDLPHVFFSPYSLFVAMVAKLCHLNSVEILSLFGILNASILFYGLNKYIESLAVPNKSATFFYSTVLIMFFWGSDPWSYSGFFHSNILNFSLPYPSAFATGMVFLAFAVNAKFKERIEFKYVLLLSVMSAAILLTQAVAFIFLCAGLVSGALGTKTEERWHLVALSVVLILTLTGALVWPYYPFLEMLRGASDVYHPSNKGVYENIFTTIWPLFLALPVIAKDFFKKQNQQLSVTIILLVMVYLIAWQLQKHSYGRVISYIAMMIQILLAIKIAQLDIHVFKNTTLKKIVPFIILIACLVAGYRQIQSMATRTLTTINSLYQGRPVLNQFTFAHHTIIEKEIEQGALVLANVKASWIIPSIGAKVITLSLPHAFVQDHEERIFDVSHFFKEDTSKEERTQVLKKYQPSYVFFNKAEDKNWLVITKELIASEIGQLVYENENVALFKIDISKIGTKK